MVVGRRAAVAGDRGVRSAAGGSVVKMLLAALDDELAEAWERHCGDLPDVTVHRGSILDLEVDAVVSPANSFGFMDGGIDHLYSDRFGWHVQEGLQELI